MPLLSIIIFLPLVFSLGILFLPKESEKIAHKIALFSSTINFILCLFALSQFDTNFIGLQLIDKAKWIHFSMGNLGTLSIDYLVGIDGLNIAFLPLSGLIFLIATISSFKIESNIRSYYALFLLLTTSVYGCFLAIDLFLFFLFFEFMLLPMYFLIGLWGGERREYAAIKFFIYTLLGSLCILVVIIALYSAGIDPYATMENLKMNTNELVKFRTMLNAGDVPHHFIVHTFNIFHLSDSANYLQDSLLSWNKHYLIWGVEARVLAMGALLIGFLVKLPAVPFHTWLPDAHVEAPTPISVILAALLLKVGGYGIIRIAYSLFPDATLFYAPYLATIGVVSIVYAALNALAMNDLKKMIAYSSISHMGFVLLGLASLNGEGITGAIFQMISHGIISAGLFITVGVLYDRTHNRLIDNYSGLANKMPLYTTTTAILFFASLGLPGFSGFVGEVLVLLGAFSSLNNLLPKWMVIFASLGILLSAAYYLWALQKIFFGKYWTKGKAEWSTLLQDLTIQEKISLYPLVFLTLLFGICPSILTSIIETSVSVFSDNIVANTLDILKNKK